MNFKGVFTLHIVTLRKCTKPFEQLVSLLTCGGAAQGNTEGNDMDTFEQGTQRNLLLHER